MADLPDHPGLRRCLHGGAYKRDGLTAEVDRQVAVAQWNERKIESSRGELHGKPRIEILT